MTDPSELRPTEPADEGVEEKTPPPMQIEGAELLADEARDRLRGEGLGDDQIDDWALTYIAEEGSGAVPSFIEWVARRQR